MYPDELMAEEIILSSKTNKMQVMLELCRTEVDTEEESKTLKQFIQLKDEVFSIDPDNIDAINLAMRMAKKQGNIKEANRLLKRRRALDSKDECLREEFKKFQIVEV
ncbi:MAG: hypothetical protein FWC68_02205 [Oscillospiraceae bacterium]|nr:hypothetical protein [Oscillospiraceae bacterium]